MFVKCCLNGATKRSVDLAVPETPAELAEAAAAAAAAGASAIHMHPRDA